MRYAIPATEYKKLPPTIPGLPSDELYDQLMAKARKTPGYDATQWIHLADAVSRGTVTPIEAYDSIILGYCPAHLLVRDSKYAHLLR